MLKLDNNSLIRDQAYIDGEWRGARSGARFAVRNPATHEVITEVADLDDDGRARGDRGRRPRVRAVARQDGQGTRGNVLRKWYELMMASQEDLAQLMTAEQGKPLAESRGEIAYGASFIEWFAEEGKRIYGDVIPTNAHGRRIIVVKEPIGVVGAVTPWNFPNAMITRKVGPALAAGCTVVVKPAQLTPLSALALAELAQRAGLPKGVFNVVPVDQVGARRQGADHEPAGEEVLVHRIDRGGQAADGAMRLDREEGLARAGRQCAVHRLRRCGPRRRGQRRDAVEVPQHGPDLCLRQPLPGAGRRLRRVRREAQEGCRGAESRRRGACRAIEQGPLINMAAVEKVEALIADGVKQGAKIDLGGKRHKLGGTFFEPTILRDATPDMAFAREEIFGPVVTLFRFAKDEDAIRMANDTEYGLAAYFYARDVGRIFSVMEGLEYGIVGVNEGIISTEVAPFGGMKESGIGREGSKYGIEDFVTDQICGHGWARGIP